MGVFERAYSDLVTFTTFRDRLEYLALGAGVGIDTFGFDRYLNQRFYKSKEWADIRRHVLLRDEGCDLAMPGYDIYQRPLVHHMNPIRPQDLLHNRDMILDPEFLITVTHQTHNQIHYGLMDAEQFPSGERTPGDTKLW